MAAAGLRLADLLRDPPYRQVWERHAKRRGSDPSFAAVAEVICAHLWDTGELVDGREPVARELKDRVARALRGSVFSTTTLRWFVEAFDIGAAQGEELLQLLGGSVQGPVIRGSMRLQLEPPRHRTISLHEFHDVGGDRLPISHRTIHVIEALVPGFSRYPYRFDTRCACVQVLHGGRTGPPRPDAHGLTAIDIELSRALDVGETASFEYVTSFSYTKAPAPEFRRAASRAVKNLDIRVRFAPDCLPTTVWWCVWADLGMERLAEEPVALDAEYVAHRYCQSVEGAVVGFRWEWG